MELLLYIYGSMNGSFYCFFHCSFSQWDFWSLSPRECAEPPWLPLKTDGNRLFLLKDLSNAQKKGPWMTWTMNHPDWFNPYNGWVVYGSIIPYLQQTTRVLVAAYSSHFVMLRCGMRSLRLKRQLMQRSQMPDNKTSQVIPLCQLSLGK